MLSVSEAYKARINNGQNRHITARVDFYFDPTPTSLYISDYLVSVDWLNELFADSEQPIGQISADTASIILNNTDQRFRPDNTLSPFAGKMVPGIQVDIYLSLEVSDGVYEEVFAGTFYVGDWDAPIGSPEASIVCYDRLMSILNKPTPAIPVQYNITYKDMYITLFTALGLTTDDYEFDDTVYAYDIVYSFLVGNTVRDTLQALSENSFTCVYMNKVNNKIRVATLKPNQGLPVDSWHDTDQIGDISRPTSILDSRRIIDIKYTVPTLTNVEELFNLQQVNVQSGTNTIVQTTNTPLRYISAVKLLNSQFSQLVSVKYSNYSVTLTIYSTIEESLGIVIEGITLSLTDLVETLNPTAAGGSIQIGNALIHSQDKAIAIGNKVDAILSINGPYLIIECLGNPTLELKDLLSVESASYDILAVDVVPLRYSYRYDGALECTITAILASAII